MSPSSQPLRPLTSPAGPAVTSAAGSSSAPVGGRLDRQQLYGSALAVCEVDRHVLLSDALARAPSKSRSRVEGWQPEPPALHGGEPPSQLGRVVASPAS